MKTVLSIIVVLTLEFFCFWWTLQDTPVKPVIPESKLTLRQHDKLIRKCGSATITTEDGTTKCFYTMRERREIKKRGLAKAKAKQRTFNLAKE